MVNIIILGTPRVLLVNSYQHSKLGKHARSSDNDFRFAVNSLSTFDTEFQSTFDTESFQSTFDSESFSQILTVKNLKFQSNVDTESFNQLLIETFDSNSTRDLTETFEN